MKELNFRLYLQRIKNIKYEFIWVISGQILQFVGLFAGIKILTNLMGPDKYGELAIGMSITGALGMLIYGPLSSTALRFFSIYNEKNLLQIYFTGFGELHRKLIWFFLPCSIIFPLIFYQFLKSDWAFLILFSILFNVFSGIYSFMINVHSAQRNQKKVALLKGIEIWLRIGLAILFIILFNTKGYTALMGYSLGNLLIILFLWKKFFEKNKDSWPVENSNSDKLNKNFQSKVIDYAYPFILFGIFGMFSTYADRWIILQKLSEHEVGLYAAIYQIANIPFLAISTLSQFSTPIIFEKAGSLDTEAQRIKSQNYLNLSIYFSLLIMIFFLIIMFVFNREIVIFLTNATFAKQSNLLWIIGLGFMFYNIAQLMCSKGLINNQPKLYILPKGLYALAFILLSFALVYTYQIKGIAISFFISSVFYMIAVYFTNKRIRPVN